MPLSRSPLSRSRRASTGRYRLGTMISYAVSTAGRGERAERNSFKHPGDHLGLGRSRPRDAGHAAAMPDRGCGLRCCLRGPDDARDYEQRPRSVRTRLRYSPRCVGGGGISAHAGSDLRSPPDHSWRAPHWLRRHAWPAEVHAIFRLVGRTAVGDMARHLGAGTSGVRCGASIDHPAGAGRGVHRHLGPVRSSVPGPGGGCTGRAMVQCLGR